MVRSHLELSFQRVYFSISMAETYTVYSIHTIAISFITIFSILAKSFYINCLLLLMQIVKGIGGGYQKILSQLFITKIFCITTYLNLINC